jgi:hypothetical protein
VSRDPLGLSAGINPYAYADGNPVLFNDPDGLMAALAWNSAKTTAAEAGTYLESKFNKAVKYIGRTPPFSKIREGQNIGGGVEVTGMIGPVGVSQSLIQSADTNYQSCSISSSCAILGLGAFLGSQAVFSAGTGLLSPGDTVGAGFFATAGIAGSGTITPVQVNLDGSVSGQVGTGAGSGIGFGVKVCRQTTFGCGPIAE